MRIDDEEVLVHNEFQTADSTNPPMPRRMAGYIGHAIRQHGLPIYSNVIYLRPRIGAIGSDPFHAIDEAT